MRVNPGATPAAAALNVRSARTSFMRPRRTLDPAGQVLPDGPDRPVHLLHRIIKVWREAKPGPVGAGARGHDETLLLGERGAELARIERAGTEDDDGGMARRIGVRPQLDAVEAPEALHERPRELADAALDHVAADRPLKPQRLRYGGKLGVVALAVALQLRRNPDCAGVQADDTGPDAVVHFLVHVQDAGLLRPAGPLVERTGIEVRAHDAQVHVEHTERLRAVHEREDALLPRRAAQLV